MAATTLPALLLGGEVAGRPGRARSPAGRRRCALPQRARAWSSAAPLLYPPDDDVAAAVDAAVDLL